MCKLAFPETPFRGARGQPRRGRSFCFFGEPRRRTRCHAFVLQKAKKLTEG
jgi:hypothetical protein